MARNTVLGRQLCLAFAGLALSGCGKEMPTALQACPEIAANLVSEDTLYLVGTHIIFGYQDVYACGIVPTVTTTPK